MRRPLIAPHLLPCAVWTEIDNALCRSFQFVDFRTAWAFLSAVAAEAERLDHHPWLSNEYGRVEFRLRTHDRGNVVTKRDHQLAAAIDAVYAALNEE